MPELFAELNPVVDEWAIPVKSAMKAAGIYGPSGWCLIGLYFIWPRYFALIIFNRGFGLFFPEPEGEKFNER